MHNLCHYDTFYYTLVWPKGKLFKGPLATDDKPTAKRKLADFQWDLGKVNASQGKFKDSA